MMQDQVLIPACFSSSEKLMDDSAGVTRSGQSVFMSVYRTKIADQCRLITITWCKNLLLHGLSVSVEGPEGESQYTCKVELKPWYFWRKQGSKRFLVEVYDEEVVLLIGDLKKDAYRKTGCRPALIDPLLVSRKEHIFGKKKFFTSVKFHEKGRIHEIAIECKSRSNNSGNLSNANSPNGVDPEMEIRIDGNLVIHVKHLQWKFRGNDSIKMNKVRLEVYWDVHDWLFSPGLRHALFIFKPTLVSSSPSLVSTSSSPPFASSLSSQTVSSGSLEGFSASGSSDFCLFLYAWSYN
ncbi:uncharacterized protein LOC113768632 [Coffea eugenioides]|uniref:uncharacterized protein LOC113768630 n=1 Tax=Coffea eugenioides TaxID=49369 RepID=UPI000F61100D|nr:uncharacterized protein LOC113768630 [Coffea eugenioides]XP_027168870.1 uncharacterized protein LOC113768632 [Coffea eugenioides]